ncbi:LppU/SCO3897 family protein [Umezawaea beigongshangensis]|uniref:LppU/SCO3897 family protein n=1 Tax=Umezawaea beigongshangensis TaxID=2780383 RepID=UPI0018F16202|nr:hypothetical protein [Umezawaea beigongshangensis]
MTTPPHQPPPGQSPGFPPRPGGQQPQQPWGPPPGAPPQPQWGQQQPWVATPPQGAPPQDWNQQNQGWAQQRPGQYPGGQHPAGQVPGGQRPASGGGRKLALAGVGVIVLVLVIVGFNVWGTGAGAAKAGECVKVTSASASDADAEKVDCSAPDASYEVAVNLDSRTASCPDGDYAEYSQKGRRSNGYRLCLMLNASVGDCFTESGSTVFGRTDKSACTSSSTFKVVEVLDRRDEAGCPNEEGALGVLTYSQPPTTLCLGEPV